MQQELILLTIIGRVRRHERCFQGLCGGLGQYWRPRRLGRAPLALLVRLDRIVVVAAAVHLDAQHRRYLDTLRQRGRLALPPAVGQADPSEPAYFALEDEQVRVKFREESTRLGDGIGIRFGKGDEEGALAALQDERGFRGGRGLIPARQASACVQSARNRVQDTQNS